MYTGSCYCGAVQFQIAAELGSVQICHCGQCRKAQGGPFASNIPVEADHFTITAGEDQLQTTESITRCGKFRVFCRECGSPVISRMASLPDVVRVRVGAIDDPGQLKIEHHQFVAYKASWFDIVDDAPQYDEYPPGR